KTLHIPVENASRVFLIDSTIILIDSVSIIDQNNNNIQISFSFNNTSHDLTFETAVDQGSVINIYGKTSPVELPREYQFRIKTILREDTSAAGAIVPSDAPVPAVRTAETVPQLLKNGSLTRSFSVGTNRGLELQSGLRMEIGGNISDDYSIQAVLTDQNTPLQPEGNTRTLHEIDKVFIDITGPKISSRFGDITVGNESSEFGRFNRKLKGVSANSTIGGNIVTAAFALSEGDYHSVRMMGAEGKQGPYVLNGKNGERNIVVLGGTEKVWVDGEEMVRGEDSDYVIDYASGHIIFTRNRLITGNSRITVDFQYINDSYNKNVYSAGISNGENSPGMYYNASFFRESDNKDNPIDIDLTEADLSVLSSAGDDASMAAKSGIVFVGEGKGKYNRVDDGEVYYVHADSGDYNIRFTYTGEGNGNYRLLNDGSYEYTGNNQGAYLPVVFLPLAGSQSFANLTAGFRDESGKFNLSGEYAYSDFDNNTFSALNDDDNKGDALKLNFALDRSALDIGDISLGKAAVSAVYRRTNEKFTRIDRTTEAEFDRKWDLDEHTVSGESIFEFSAKYNPKDFIEISPSIGKLALGDSKKTDRQSVGLSLGTESDKRVDYLIEDISSSSGEIEQDWIRHRSRALYQYRGFTPSVAYESEKKTGDIDLSSEYNFRDWSGMMRYDRENTFTVYGQFQRREDENYVDGDLLPNSTAVNRIFHIEYRNGRRLFTRIHYVNRKREYENAEGSKKTDLADIKIQSQELNGGMRTRFDMQLSNEQLPDRQKIYQKVEDGKGSFSIDELTGEYYPDPNGSYELTTITTSQFHGEKRTRLGLTFDLDPAKFLQNGETKNVFRNIRTHSIFRFENSRNEDNDGGEPIYKRASIIQDVFILERKARFNMRLRQSYMNTKNNRIIGRKDYRSDHQYSVRLRSRFNPKTDYESNLVYERSVKDISESGDMYQEIKTFKGDVGCKFRPDRYWDFSLRFLGAVQSDDSGAEKIELSYFSISPRITRAFLGSGRLNAEIEYFRVNAKGIEKLA
ncbi:MAG: hypothetical protein GY863_10825, partial [bacterium]|nr:hypothetical protein [bacterium]